MSIEIPNHFFVNDSTSEALKESLQLNYYATHLDQDLSNLISKTQIKSKPSSILNLTPEHSDVDTGSWIDCGDFYLSTTPQGCDVWKEEREGRVTGSTSGGIIGKSRFTDPDKEARYLAGIDQKEFTEYQLMIMKEGNIMEPEARDHYVEETGYTVYERGLIVPKWNPFIGVSVDGDVIDTNGCLEIKCPQKMYKPLIDYYNKINSGHKFPPFFHSHIWDSHYCQMQLGMAVLGKDWFDYKVYCPNEGQSFRQRVLWNQEYWENTLYPGILKFLDGKLFPLITRLPIIPK